MPSTLVWGVAVPDHLWPWHMLIVDSRRAACRRWSEGQLTCPALAAKGTAQAPVLRDLACWISPRQTRSLPA